MKTRILKINANDPEEEIINEAAKILKEGGLVAFPTETVYGLGGSAFDKKAAEKIYKAKGRPSDNPLIVHINNKNGFKELSREFPEITEKLIDKFTPGPVTFILKKKDVIPDSVTGGLDTVALRFPSDKVAQALIEAAGPIAAPSANLSGRPSPTDAKSVIEDLDGRVDMILVSDDSKIGVESTVIDLTKEIPVLLRPGMVTPEELKEITGKLEISEALLSGKHVEKPLSPGLKYRHYAPKGEVRIISGTKSERLRKIKEELKKSDQKTGLLLLEDYNEPELKEYFTVVLGEDPKAQAKLLFKALRDFDREDIELILAEEIDSSGFGLAPAERLLRAGAYKRI